MDQGANTNNSSAQQFEALFNYATIGMIVTDDKARIINYNKFAESQFGYTKEEILGKQVEILIPVTARHQHIEYRNHFYEHPAQRKMGEGRDLFAMRKDGSTFPVEISLSHYKINDQTFVIAFVIDITVRKKSESLVLEQKEELERVAKQIRSLNVELENKVEDRTKMLRETLSALEHSKEELSEALRNERELGELKSRFVTMASHEFRTPLSAILSSAYLLQKYNSPEYTSDADYERRDKHLQRIKGAVEDMKSILEDFLSLGKLEEGLVKAKIETLSASDCFEEMKQVIASMDQLLKPGQKINFHHNETFFDIQIDKQLMKNMLINLISNSIKFSPENSEIEVSCFINLDHILISVKDSGIGISEEDQQHLFTRFFRAKNAANIQGTGLGLHIIAKYLELIGGTISIESKLNEGSLFSIYIPQPIEITTDNENDPDH